MRTDHNTIPKEIWVRSAMNSITGKQQLSCAPQKTFASDTKYIRADIFSQWQPIATAPKDGSFILVSGGDIDTELGSTEKQDSVAKALYEWDGYDDETSEDLYSWVVADGCYYRVKIINPTHWMPIPNPPHEGE